MITDEVLFRYLSGDLSERENRTVDHWLAADPVHQARLDSLRKFWEVEVPAPGSEAEEAEWLTVESRMKEAVPSIRREPKKISLRYAAIAASLLILLGTGMFMLLHQPTRTIRNHTLATQTHYLPDGSEVNLGPDSRLTFKKNMAPDQRTVTLTGEAYFDVTADPGHPFIVKTGLASIEVTGTRFVVNASRKTDEVEVSVKAGKVLFYNSDIMTKNAFRMGLGPGEKGIYSPGRNRMDKTLDPGFYSVP